MRLLAAVLALALAGCVATDPVRPEVKTNTVLVPTPVPCLDAADVPPMPEPVPVDVATASTDQLAAAAAADVEAYERYSRAVRALLEQCVRQGGKK